MFGKKPSSDPSSNKPASPTTVPGQSLVPSQSTTVSRAETTAPVQQQAAGALANQEAPSIMPQGKPIEEGIAVYTDPKLETREYKRARELLLDAIFDHPTFRILDDLKPEERRNAVSSMADEIITNITIPLTGAQLDLLKQSLIDEVLGFGPLEVLLADPDIADIMVNTAHKIYIEKKGKLSLTDVKFASERHLLNVIQKIVSRVGRRVDENSPMVDARMPDGSRFNAIVPPLALDGSLVSIRKFKKNKMPLRQYVEFGSMSPEMVQFLEICAAIRLNIIVSGGTGSGKTTLLNALSGHIDVGERVITIEDAAELQMHQPHVLRLETRPANIEGSGEITQRQLVRNALRMRPDRIILGEIRGDEVLDVLAAMNTGHDGSMATIHSNNPRDCLGRIENLMGMAGVKMPVQAMRAQISSAVNLIVQIGRMRDGSRRITHIEEVVGMQGDVISTQTLFSYQSTGLDEQGRLIGQFNASGIRPSFMARAAYFNREAEINDLVSRAVRV
jgi:pilus assembly protein CpaF